MGSLAHTLYVVEEANLVLPLVRSIVKDIVDDFRLLRTAGRERRVLEIEAQTDVHNPSGCALRLESLKDEVGDHSRRIEGYLEELSALSIEVRDLELGLIDFPALIDGEPAYLSWRLGESGVGYWHPADCGFTERKPVPEALLVSGV